MSEESEVKIIIKSLLISNPLRMTVNDLYKEYRHETGNILPYERFGYNNLLHYLRSIPDVLQVIGEGAHAELRAVVSHKSAHIVDLISKQRVVQKWTNKPRSRRIRYNETNQIPRLTKRFESIGVQDHPCANATKQNGAVPKTIKHEQSMVDNIVYRVPFVIQENLKVLIAKYDNGVLCSELFGAYKTDFGQELEYMRFGYTSLLHMCLELKYIFNWQRTKLGDYRLYDINKPMPLIDDDDDDDDDDEIALDQIENCSAPALPDNIEDLLKGMNAHYPPDVVEKGFKIPVQKVTDIQDEYAEIRVSEVHDPSKFWFNELSKVNKLDYLMNDMQEFYNANCKRYEIPLHLLDVGMYCTVYCLNEFHRAVIVELLHNDEECLKAYTIDYGTIETVPMKGIYYLHRKFEEFPAQAIRGRLAGIRPRKYQTVWPFKTTQALLTMVRNKAFVAKITKYSEEDRVYELIVVDTSGESDIFINDELVAKQLAIFDYQTPDEFEDRESEVLVEDIHFYPTFSELENARAPTADEMKYMRRNYQPWHFIYPHYFKAASPVAHKTPSTPSCSSSSSTITLTPATFIPPPQIISEKQEVPAKVRRLVSPMPTSSHTPPPSAVVAPLLEALPAIDEYTLEKFQQFLFQQKLQEKAYHMCDDMLNSISAAFNVTHLDMPAVTNEFENLQIHNSRKRHMVLRADINKHTMHLFLHNEETHLLASELYLYFFNDLTKIEFRRKLAFEMHPVNIDLTISLNESLKNHLLRFNAISIEDSDIDCLRFKDLGFALKTFNGHDSLPNFNDYLDKYHSNSAVWNL